MKQEYYQKQYEKKSLEATQLMNSSNIFSLLRFIAFIASVVFLIVGYYDSHKIFLGVGIISFISFMYLIYLDTKIEWQIKICNSFIETCTNYLKRYDHTWQDFKNNGEHLSDDDFRAIDLDLVGKNSLFQYLVLARSRAGQQKLYDLLVKNKTMSNNQNAVSELANAQDLHLKLTSLINLFDDEKSDLVLNDKHLLSKRTRLFYQIAVYVNPLLLLLLLALTIIGVLPTIVVVLMLLVNASFILVPYTNNREYLKSINAHHKNLDILIKVIEEIEQYDYTSQKLKNIKDTLVAETNASKSLKKLVKLKEKIESQSNAIMYLIVELTTLWDYRNVLYFDKWKQRSGKNAQKYLDIFYELEVLLSLGVIEQTKENTALPKIKISSIPYLEATQLYHPLLNPHGVVANDIKTTSETIIITGSNMSGKTTFIRSVGINLVLAYAGASVCATNLNASLMKVLTSIRVEDDFNQGISTFYAEIKRIKTMVDYASQHEPMICFVDEIFKGTNSEDRIYGAQKAIEALIKPHIISFITTHDAQLCVIDKVVNYHFKEYYENDKLMFDYKIQPGVSQTRNAKYLLKMAGIVLE